VLQILTGTLYVAGIEIIEGATKAATDDIVIEAGKDLQQIPVALYVVLTIVQVMLHCIGVQGAIAYKKWMIYCALASYTLNFVIYIIQINIVGVFLSVGFAYPHFFFIHEMNQNIMSMFCLCFVCVCDIVVANASWG
jgi:hypothetical protein